MWVCLCGYIARSGQLSYSFTSRWLRSSRNWATVLRKHSASAIRAR
jgi:hypothetical protein